MIDLKEKTVVLKGEMGVRSGSTTGYPANTHISFYETTTCRCTVVTDRTL